MKRLIGIVCILLLLGAVCTPVFADNIGDFLRGDEPDEKLCLDYGIAKRIDLNKDAEDSVDVILELRREHEIDNWRTADYTIRTTVEF